MALATAIDSISLTHIRPKVVDNFFDENTFLKYMKEKKKVSLDEGKDITVPIQYDDLDATGWITGRQLLSITPNQTVTNALFGWKETYGTISWDGTELIQNSGSSGELRIVKTKIDALKRTISNNINTALFNLGTTATQIDGIRLMCDSAGTYPNTTGGIATTDYSGWAGKEDGSTTTLTRAALVKQIKNQSGSGNDAPDLGVTRPSVMGKLDAIVGPQERYGDETARKAGFTSLAFMGIPFLQDTAVPGSDGGSQTNHIFLLNTNYLEFVIHSKDNFRMTKVQEALDQKAWYQKMFVTCNLLCSRRNRQGKMSTIDPDL